MTRKRRGLSMTSILVLALVGTITAIVLGAMAVFLQTYQRSLIRSVQTSARQSVAQVGKTVEDYLDDVNSLMELLERKLEDPRQDRDDFFAAFLQIRPDVVAVTTYDAAGGLVDCRSRAAKRTEIYQNLSFDPDKMDAYAGGYVSTPHVASIFQGYYPWVVTLVAPLDAPGREEWIALDISFSSISAYLNDVGIGQHGYCFLMDQSGNIIYHPQQQLIYSDLKRENTSLIAGLPDGELCEAFLTHRRLEEYILRPFFSVRPAQGRPRGRCRKSHSGWSRRRSAAHRGGQSAPRCHDPSGSRPFPCALHGRL